MTLIDLEFTAEDFACACLPEFNCKGEQCVSKRVAQATIANIILREKLEKAPLMEVTETEFGWIGEDTVCGPQGRTHTARLVCITRKVRKRNER